MKYLRKFLGIVLLSFLVGLIIPNIVKAAEVDTDELIKKLAPDMENATLKSVVPSTPGEGQFMINTLISGLLSGKGYLVDGYCMGPEYTECEIFFQSNKFVQGEYGEEPEWYKEYNLTFHYDTPSAESTKTIRSYLDRFKNITMGDVTTYYTVEDLSLINYYATAANPELWNTDSSSIALRFTNIAKDVDNADISFKFAAGAGGGTLNGTYEEAMGEATIYHNGYAYGSKTSGIYLNRVIYIPESTEENKEAYINAAQKRIDDYLGSKKYTITYGGLLSSINSDLISPSIDPNDTDGNFYNIQIGTKTFKFLIVKAPESKLTAPIYNGTNLDTNVSVKSSDTSVPLDASLKVLSVNDSSIADKIKSNNYVSYDISLYSENKGANIEKLSSGKFEVSIPISSSLEGSDLIVYYINNNGEIEEHSVTIDENGFAIFETDHFSVYTLAALSSNNPQTGDNISLYITLLLIGLTGTYITLLYLKKHKN